MVAFWFQYKSVQTSGSTDQTLTVKALLYQQKNMTIQILFNHTHIHKNSPTPGYNRKWYSIQVRCNNRVVAAQITDVETEIQFPPIWNISSYIVFHLKINDCDTLVPV